ncbi:MAG TPA: response regulator [Gemmatimonadaceae bacterium]|nr:response regulator [Gemmatimonadaceae bacterium]
MSFLLFADDNEDMRLMLRDLFRSVGHEVALAADGAAALEAIEQREPDLVILDHSMPTMTGIDVCRRMKANPFTARIPVLMLTAQGGMESKIEGFAAGADDYLAKPFDPRELRARVTALLRLVQREGDRNPTSGLPGGRGIDREIGRRIDRGESFAVCYLDLDNFKPFADTYGFAIADEIIRSVGAALRSIVALGNGGSPHAGPDGDGNPNVEFVGHIGGDDFIVICSPQRAEAIAALGAERCREAFATVVGTDAMQRGSFRGVDREGIVREFPLASISAAIVLVRPEAWVNLAHLGMRAADAKRRAKQRGPGSIYVDRA